MTRSWIVPGALVVALVATGCAPDASDRPPGPGRGPTVSGDTVPSSPVSTQVPEEPDPAAPPRFRSSISRIGAALADRMRASWRPGCPVPLKDLRYVTLSHWGFDGEVHQGELVVHADQATAMVSAFRDMFDARFPIRRMVLVDEYGADDDASMAANNTSAFNCRLATGGDSWSEHAYGRAIDINPIQNPYVTSTVVLPPAGRRYVDRSQDAKGMIHGGDAVVRAFAAIGWEWGGQWTSLKDYQHFSQSGR